MSAPTIGWSLAAWLFGSGRDDSLSRGQRPTPATVSNDLPDIHEDAPLLARLRASDETALAAIIEAHYTRLCRYAYHTLGSADLAESAVLDVLTTLWDRRTTVVVRTTLLAYLTGAVRLRAANVARARRVESAWEERAGREQTTPGMATAPVATDAMAAEQELRQAVASAVAQFPPRCRDVFELVWYGGLSYAEAAGQLGISVKGVEAQMARAYRSLRNALAHFA